MYIVNTIEKVSDGSPESGCDQFVFLPLGGAGEIGMNLNLFGFGPPGAEEWVIVDCGIGFSDSSLLGANVEMADPKFISDRRDKLLAIIVTHAHEDHIGAIPYLWPKLRCPVYATAFAATILRRKLEETDFADSVEIHIVQGDEFTVGPFSIRYIGITHSIPESNSILIRTPTGTVLHTGDWKIDSQPLVGNPTAEEQFRELESMRIDALICDSTNVFKRGWSGSESLVKDTLEQLLGNLTGRVAVTAFASNIARMDSVIRAGAMNNRKTLLLGRAMQNMVSAARQNGLLAQLPELCSEEEAANLAPHKLLILCTGSQGQPGAAIDRISRGANRDISLGPGDTVIFSSRTIPGNEIAIASLQNRLAHLGVAIITDSDELVHVSGHPYRDELKRMYEWVRPRLAIPVHGEPRHLREHARLAYQLGTKEVVVAENGTLVRITPEPSTSERVSHIGKLHLDGELLVSSAAKHLRNREQMANCGFVGVTIIFRNGGRAEINPAIFFEGIPLPVQVTLRTVISDTLRNSGIAKKRGDQIRLEQSMSNLIAETAATEWGKVPLIRIASLKH